MSLGSIIVAVCQMRQDMRGAGASELEIEKATERSVRASWPTVDERMWPAWMTLARCAYCDGTGLVIHRNVKNRLGLIVDEGTPCRCPQGQKFLPKMKSEADFQEAGKVSKPKRNFSRFGS
jgi:hypothetical protein